MTDDTVEVVDMAAKSSDTDEYLRGLAERMTEARVGAGLGQMELSAAIGTNPAQISRYENGRNVPGVDVVRRIADATGADFGWLVTGRESIADDAPHPALEELASVHEDMGLPLSRDELVALRSLRVPKHKPVNSVFWSAVLGLLRREWHDDESPLPPSTPGGGPESRRAVSGKNE